MSGALLGWDDFEDENPNVKKAVESIRTIDTSAVEAEMEAEAQARADMTKAREMGMVEQTPFEALIDNKPKDVNAIGTKGITLPNTTIDYGAATTAMARAEIAVAEYGKQFTFGERVEAKNKRLINATTDLNQLIPFKYPWAWSMYLDSTSAHWMPTEMEGYLHDEKNYPDLSLTEKKLVSRLVVNYMYSQYSYPAVMTVNLYRLSTNPEVRQYELRQAFEEQVFHHSMRHMVEIFDLDKDDIRLHSVDEQTYKDRHDAIRPYIGMLKNLEVETTSIAEIGEFLVALSMMYGGMRGLFHLVPMFQIWHANKTTGILPGVTDNVKAILRDMNRQHDFGVRYIAGIIEENPDVFTSEVQWSIIEGLLILHESNVELLNTLNLSPESVAEGVYTSQWFMSNFLHAIGVNYPTERHNPQYEGYIELFKSCNGSHDNAATTTTGSGGSLGTWD